MKALFKNKDSYLLLFILLLAAVLRFYNAFNIPFTHDEFSALFRLEYDNFSDLIANGVVPDGHPAGVHVFLYYWTKLFGFKEFVVKLPFILMGIASVFLVWLIARNWFNSTVALLVALLLATLEYPLMHSQIARPYISGLFFSLWMVYEWTMYLFNTKSKVNKHLIFYVLASAICAYNHHFSLLFAAIVGLSALFFIKRDRLLTLVLAGLSIFLLYIPHLPIFFYQLNTGGIGGEDGWLGVPQSDFLWEYIKYIFNFSWLLMISVALIILAGIFLKDESVQKKKKFFMLSIFWFLVPFLIGYFYSHIINPVLQYSLLIFSFPFFFFILFGHLKELSFKWNAILLLILTPVLVFSLLYERNYYSLFYNSPYEGIVLESDDFQESYNHESTASFIDFKYWFADYYIEKYKLEITPNFMEDIADERALITRLKLSDLDKISYGSLANSNPETVAIMTDYFPNLKTKIDFNQGNFYELFKEGESGIELYRSGDFINDFNKLEEHWKWDTNSAILKDSIADDFEFVFEEGQEWGMLFEIELSELIAHENDLIDVRLDIKSWNPNDELLIVSEIIDDSDKYDWRSSSSREYIPLSDSSEYRMYHSIKLSDIHFPTNKARVKIYCWNKGKTQITIDDFSIKIRIGNPILYGLFKKIDQN